MALQRSVIACVSGFLLLVVLCSGPAVGEGESFMDDRLDCRSLSPGSCAFAVDTYGARCVLEISTSGDGLKVYQCQTSDIVAYEEGEHIESEECVNACGLDRMTVGISTDAFFVPDFAGKLCSIKCQTACINIVDLFSNVVASAAEGASLDRFCNDFQSRSTRRQMRAGQFSMSDLSSINWISPSSIADGPDSGFAEGPTSNVIAKGPVSSAEAPEDFGSWMSIFT